MGHIRKSCSLVSLKMNALHNRIGLRPQIICDQQFQLLRNFLTRSIQRSRGNIIQVDMPSGARKHNGLVILEFARHT